MEGISGDTLILLFEGIVGYVVFRMSQGFNKVLVEIQRQNERAQHQDEFNRARDKMMIDMMKDLSRRLEHPASCPSCSGRYNPPSKEN